MPTGTRPERVGGLARAKARAVSKKDFRVRVQLRCGVQPQLKSPAL